MIATEFEFGRSLEYGLSLKSRTSFEQGVICI